MLKLEKGYLLRTLIIIFMIIIFNICLGNNVYAVENKSDDGMKIYMSRVLEDGAYYISTYQNNNCVLDIENGSLDNGAKLQLWIKNNTENQRFYIQYAGNGYYKIYNVKSAKALDVPDSSKDVETKIQQYESNDLSSQRWKIRKNIDGSYNFIAECSGLALDVENGIIEDGTRIQQYTYTNSNAQKFKLEKTSLLNEGIVSIKKETNHNMALDVNNNTSEDKTQIQLWEENQSLSQCFEIHKVSENEVRIRTASSGGWLTELGTVNGSKVVQLGNSSTPINNENVWILEWNNGITFKNKESGLYLDVDWNGNENGTKIQVWEKNSNQESQRFIVNETQLIKNGWYEIAASSGKVLDLENSGSDWGTNIIIYDRTQNNNQKFKIEKKDDGYVIYTMHNLTFDVEEGSREDGASIRQWEDNGASCQRWIPEIKDGGYIAFKNVNSGKYIDIENESADNGAKILQNTGNNSKSQLWKLTETNFIVGWVNNNGNWYCYDPQTGELIKNTTRIDPMMQDPAQYGSLYDFDNEGRASWHLPTFDDLPGGHGKDAPIPELIGDQRQRTLLLALSRVGCDYELLKAPTGFVCDGLTAWCVTNATGIRFKEGSRDDDQDMSWQYPYIKNKNGIKTDLSQIKAGDLMFWGDPAYIENHETYGSRHASIYYHDGLMIHAASPELGVIIGNLDNDLIGFGSPYDTETSRAEIPR